MLFKEIRFPEDIQYGATGGPAFLTDVAQSIGGQVFTNGNWQFYQPSYDVSHVQNSPDAYASILRFFLAVKGRRYGFRFKDWNDYQVLSGQGIFKQLTATTFQMYKRYILASSEYVAGTITITGTGTSRTATVTGDTPFHPDDVTAGTIYIAMAGGAYLRIIGYTSSSVVTVETPSTYVNESAVTYSKADIYEHKITKPVKYADSDARRVIVTGGSGVSIDYRSGIVTVSSGTPTSFVGEFDQPCMFENDKLEPTIESFRKTTWQNIRILGIPS